MGPIAMSESRVGLIGVGLLGSALAERMVGARLVINGYDSDWAYYDQLHPPRATVVKMSSAAQLAQEHDTIVMCLPDSKIVKSVVEELSENLRAGTLLIDATTGDPAVAEEIARHLAERQI